LKIDNWKESNFLPQRLIFFAEGGGGGGVPENLSPEEGGEGQSGVSEEAAERAAEERRQGAKAAKKQKKEEKKVKKREHKLAHIIRDFINGAGRDDKMSLLLSRLFQRNTPVTVLLAVLSLNYPEIVEILDNQLEEEKDAMPDDTPIEDFQSDTTAIVQYGKEISQSLAEWTKRIFTYASFRPMKSIIALAHHHGVDHNMIQLTALMVQRYFQESRQEVEFDRIKEFSELFWRDALKRLHHLANERGLLPEPTADPMTDEDEDDDDDEDED